MSFHATTHQNEYLPAGSDQVHAIVTVTAEEGTGSATASERCIVLIVDTSGSMSNPMSKIIAARRAVAAAVAEIPDGVQFAVIAGDHRAELVYPHSGTDLVAADATTRAEAIEVAQRLDPSGGTAISEWLALANQLFEGHDDAIKLAYLLTDGKNESEPAAQLRRVLGQCVGQFQCDARGVGDAWVVDELRTIASALLGEVSLVREPEEMEQDFQDFLERSMGRAIRDVRLRVWAPKGAQIGFLKQVSPAIEDLTTRGEDDGPLTLSFPTGAWSAGETRDYHLSITVPPGDISQEKLAARVALVVDGEPLEQSLVRAVWTEDHALTTRINPQVAHYTGQAELAEAIAEGLKARKDGDEAKATVKLGRAVQLAHESGNEGTIRLLKKVVDVDDAASGTVRVKRKVEQLDEMELDTRSTRTVRVTAKND